MTEYLQHAKTLVDQLALVGHPIPKQYAVERICNHLGKDSESLIIALSLSFSSLPMKYLTTILLTQEAYRQYSHLCISITCTKVLQDQPFSIISLMAYATIKSFSPLLPWPPKQDYKICPNYLQFHDQSLMLFMASNIIMKKIVPTSTLLIDGCVASMAT